MRRVFLAFVLLCLATTLRGSASEYVTLDGQWWSNATQDTKIAVIEGVLFGIRKGYEVAVMHVVVTSLPANKWVSEMQKSSKNEPSYSKTFGAYVSLVDAVYADYSAQKIPLENIMICLQDSRPGFAGTDECIEANKKAPNQ